MQSKVSFLRTSFVLAVPNAERAAQYWCDVLGFKLVMVTDGWRFVARGPCPVMLGECPDSIPPGELGDHNYFGYIEIDDLDSYYREITACAAIVISPPTDKPWGMREMPVKTPDGHRIMFGQQHAPASN